METTKRPFLILFLAMLPGMLIGQVADRQVARGQYDLSNPRSTISRHLYYLNEGNDPGKSAQALFSDSITEEHIELAIKLKQIFDATGKRVKPDLIPDDPNFKDSTLNAHRYVIFPKRLPDVFVERYRTETSDSTITITWRYAQSTIALISEIHEETIPIGAEWLMNLTAGLGEETFFDIQVWQYLGIVLTGLICFLMYLFLDWLFGFMIRRVIPKVFPKSFLRRELIPPVTHPLSWLLVLLMLRSWLIPSLLLPIEFSEWIITILKVLPSVFGIIVFYRFVDILADVFSNLTQRTETTMDDQLVPMISTGAKLLILAFGTIFVLQNLNVNVTALLAGVSIGGLAIALAAQDTVKNFIGSLTIFIDRPFTVGDFIDAGSFSGVVTQVGVRSTRLRATDGALVSVPNGRLMDLTITNHGIRSYRRFATTLTISYDTSPELIEKFVDGVRTIAIDHPGSSRDSVLVQFHEMADSSLNVFFSVNLDTVAYGDWLRAKQEILLQIIRFAEQLEISFAYPSTSVYVESFPHTPLSQPTNPPITQ